MKNIGVGSRLLIGFQKKGTYFPGIIVQKSSNHPHIYSFFYEHRYVLDFSLPQEIPKHLEITCKKKKKEKIMNGIYYNIVPTFDEIRKMKKGSDVLVYWDIVNHGFYPGSVVKIDKEKKYVDVKLLHNDEVKKVYYTKIRIVENIDVNMVDEGKIRYGKKFEDTQIVLCKDVENEDQKRVYLGVVIKNAVKPEIYEVLTRNVSRFGNKVSCWMMRLDFGVQKPMLLKKRIEVVLEENVEISKLKKGQKVYVFNHKGFDFWKDFYFYPSVIVDVDIEKQEVVVKDELYENDITVSVHALRMDNFKIALEGDILGKIFEFLDAKTAVIASRTCFNWYESFYKSEEAIFKNNVVAKYGYDEKHLDLMKKMFSCVRRKWKDIYKYELDNDLKLKVKIEDINFCHSFERDVELTPGEGIPKYSIDKRRKRYIKVIKSDDEQVILLSFTLEVRQMKSYIYVIHQICFGVGDSNENLVQKECLLHANFCSQSFTRKFKDVKIICPKKPGLYAVVFFRGMMYTPEDALKVFEIRRRDAGFQKILAYIDVKDPLGIVWKKYAFVVGNSDYSGGLSKLSSPEKDAKGVTKLLESVGFEVTLSINAKKGDTNEKIKNFLKELNKLERKCKKNERFLAVIYFRYLINYPNKSISGHGGFIGTTQVLFPVDFDKSLLSIDKNDKKNQQIARYQVRKNCINLGQLHRYAKYTENTKFLILTDCCRNEIKLEVDLQNSYVKSSKKSKGFTDSTRQSQNDAVGDDKKGYFLDCITSFAVGIGHQAKDGSSGCSPYTKSLLSVLDPKNFKKGQKKDIAVLLKSVRSFSESQDAEFINKEDPNYTLLWPPVNLL